MPRFGSTPFAIPDFRGAARLLVLLNLAAICVIELTPMAFPATAPLFRSFVFFPNEFLHGALWQPFTYSLVHGTISGTLLELLSVWFLSSFLENYHGANWVIGLYTASVVGAALGSTAIYLGSGAFGSTMDIAPLYGSMGGIFGMLMVIGILYGDVQFMMFFVIGIKARYLAIIYALVAIATLFTSQRVYAFAQLGGAAVALLYIKLMPRRGAGFALSEGMYGMRNRYFRWKRRRAARKFEVYMRKQGRTVKFDGQGKLIDEDHDDKKRWN